MINHRLQIMGAQVIGNFFRMFLESNVDDCGSGTGFKKRDEAIELLIKGIGDVDLKCKAAR